MVIIQSELDTTAGPLEPPASWRTPFEVLLIDPSALNRSCFSAGLSIDPSITVVAYGDVASVVPAEFSRGMPDLVILRVLAGEPSKDDVEHYLRALSGLFPPTATMLIAPTAEAGHMLTALRHKVEGLTTDQLSIALTIDVMRLVHAGMLVYPRNLFEILQQGRAPVHGRAPPSSEPRIDRLTPRQHDVVRLIAVGLSNRAIAQQLSISESTVKVHVRAIMERLGIVNRTQAAALFLDIRAEAPGAETIASSPR